MINPNQEEITFAVVTAIANAYNKTQSPSVKGVSAEDRIKDNDRTIKARINDILEGVCFSVYRLFLMGSSPASYQMCANTSDIRQPGIPRKTAGLTHNR